MVRGKRENDKERERERQRDISQLLGDCHFVRGKKNKKIKIVFLRRGRNSDFVYHDKCRVIVCQQKGPVKTP
jgi:hypothetical protein